MKINESNSAINLLFNSKKIKFPPNLSEGLFKAMDFMLKEFPNKKEKLKSTIEYVSSPFHTAYLKGKNTLLKLLLKEIVQQSGTFIIPALENDSSTIFYELETRTNGSDLATDGWILVFLKGSHMTEPLLSVYAELKDGFITTFFGLDSHQIQVMIAEILGLILFKKYCEVETKIIAPGQKATHVGEKYINKTKLPIEILDSTWFTTIVRSEGFIVGGETGFLRWQPFGLGLSQKKLIWVAPYEKKGYTRKAKILRGKEDNGPDSTQT